MRLLYIGLLLLISASRAHASVSTVSFVELSRYTGRWYQLAANPMPFDADCVCSQQTLTSLSNGQIGVYNSCNRGTANGPFSDIRGVATVVDKETNAKLSVDFGLPFKGSYWIIALDSDYNWAIVSDASARSLFILSRTPQVSAQELQDLIEHAARQTDVSKLKLTDQKGCVYPQAG